MLSPVTHFVAKAGGSESLLAPHVTVGAGALRNPACQFVILRHSVDILRYIHTDGVKAKQTNKRLS